MVGSDAMVPLALGTQTGGSVIRPATYCGTVGYKPTFQDINRNGVLPNSPSFDTVGLFVRALDDLVIARNLLLGDDVAPAGSEIEWTGTAPDVQYTDVDGGFG